MCLRDTDGTQSVSLEFPCTKTDEGGEEEEKLEQSAFVTIERHKVV